MRSWSVSKLLTELPGRYGVAQSTFHFLGASSGSWFLRSLRKRVAAASASRVCCSEVSSKTEVPPGGPHSATDRCTHADINVRAHTHTAGRRQRHAHRNATSHSQYSDGAGDCAVVVSRSDGGGVGRARAFRGALAAQRRQTRCHTARSREHHARNASCDYSEETARYSTAVGQPSSGRGLGIAEGSTTPQTTATAPAGIRDERAKAIANNKVIRTQRWRWWTR
jgi:hypothetical protein